MKKTDYINEIVKWLTTPEQEILNVFSRLYNAYSYGQGDYRSVYIPGKRKDPVLLVAHADTVWQDSPNIKIAYKNGMFFSDERTRGLTKKENNPYVGGFGIGADDRAGIAMLWLLKDLGHSLLITNCEENGCLSSIYRMSSSREAELIQNHNFIVQLDRKGKNDLVFYNVGTEEFVRYCEESTGYKFAEGSSTDIKVLCEKIPGVNISVGYQNEHTCNEVLNLRWWLSTYNTLLGWLSSNNIPKFNLY